MIIMNEDSTPEFRIRLDDEPTQPKPVKSSPKDGHPSVKKLGRRMTLTTLLLFILVVGAMVAGYLDIKKRLLTVHHTGTLEAQNLSTDIQSKFSSLSLKSASLEETLNQITNTQSSLKSSMDTLKMEAKTVSQLLDKIATSKADKKEVTASAAALTQKIAPLSDKIQKQSDAIAAIKKMTQESLSTLRQTAVQAADGTRALQEKFDALRAEKVSKKELLAEIDHLQKNQDKLEIDLKRVITRLEINVNELEKALQSIKFAASPKAVVSPAPTAPSSGKQASPAPATPSSGNSYPPQKAGQLLEQDISQ